VKAYFKRVGVPWFPVVATRRDEAEPLVIRLPWVGQRGRAAAGCARAAAAAALLVLVLISTLRKPNCGA
jgi:hypothetical protein